MNTFENSFLDERDFIDCLNRGCEIAFCMETRSIPSHTLLRESASWSFIMKKAKCFILMPNWF